jgi:hypothetical protein
MDVPNGFVDGHALQAMIKMVNDLAQSKDKNGKLTGEGEVPITDLLEILDFKEDAKRRILAARPKPVRFKFNKDGTGTATNEGLRIKEPLPLAKDFPMQVSIVINPVFRCKVDSRSNAAELYEIVGLFVDPPILPLTAVTGIKASVPNNLTIDW